MEVEYFSGVPQIRLDGNYALSRYTVYRAPSADGPFMPITQQDVLCIASCFVEDRTAVPGRTYWYRFDVTSSQAGPQRHGPYEVAIAAPYPGPFHARVYPNPARDESRIEVYLLGAAADAPLETRATIVDLQGRTVRSLARRPLPRGTSTLSWDGRDDRGVLVPSGHYFVRLTSPLGGAIHRVVRAR